MLLSSLCPRSHAIRLLLFLLLAWAVQACGRGALPQATATSVSDTATAVVANPAIATVAGSLSVTTSPPTPTALAPTLLPTPTTVPQAAVAAATPTLPTALTSAPAAASVAAPTIALPTNSAIKDIVTLVNGEGGRTDWSPQNLIAFSKFGSGKFNAEIYVMHPDATNQVCLTCGKASLSHLNNDQPAWTPNGKYVLFQSVDPVLYDALKGPVAEKQQLAQGGAGIDNNFWVITADGQHVAQLTHVKEGEATLHPHFSNDGKKLFWSTRVSDGNGAARTAFHWALATADFVDDANAPHLVNTKVFTPLGIGPFYESHDWAPDDSYALFSSNANPSPQNLPCVCALSIWKLDLATGQATELTNTTNVWNEHAHPTPDGKKITWLSSQGYAFTPSGNWGATLKLELWMMNPDGSNKQQLTSFNTPGSPEFNNGHRIILADGSWNPTGDKYLITVADIGGGTATSRIIVIEFNAAQ